MTNARCLTEGVDLPAIDCVCFTDPKRSKVDIVQAAGRALRLSPGKKFGYILIPIFIPADQDPETASKDGAFEEVVATVGALSTQDTRIAEYLRAVTEGRKPTGGSPVDGTISVNVLTKIDPDLFNKAIQLKIWDKIASVNYRSYQEARKYVKKLNLKSFKEWASIDNLRKKPKDIPRKPENVYKDFISYTDFLGTDYVYPTKRHYVDYKQAKKFAQSLNLLSMTQWRALSKEGKLPKNIPGNPWGFYKEFEGNRTFIGKKYLSYDEVEKFAQKLKIKTQKAWTAYIKKNPERDIPKAPNLFYKEWKGWGHFLNTGNTHKGNYKTLNELINYLKKNKIYRPTDYKNLYIKGKIPKCYPRMINKVYKTKSSSIFKNQSDPKNKKIN
jgi:hypothetical protein